MLYDRDIREPLFEYLEEQYGKCRIIEEKSLGRSRADVVMVLPDAVYGIEIKSDADTYARLSKQVEDYDKYFDCNYVVVGASHGAHIQEHVPDHWGIITVEMEEKPDFYCLREPEKNQGINMERKLSMLWRPELAHIQELNDMHKYKDKSKLFVIQKIIDTVDFDVLNRQISEELFERDYEKIGETIAAFRKENKQKPRRKKRISKRYKVK